MPFVRINGVNFYYESHGSGFPLALTWGFGGNTSMWDEQVEAFSSEYRFITWDPRGHGCSETPPDWRQYGQDTVAEDLLGLLDHLEIKRACVGGLSMGGGAAVHFATAHPERVAALLIIDSFSASGQPLTGAKRDQARRALELAETEDMAAVAEFQIKESPSFNRYAQTSPEARERLRRMFLTMTPLGYANTYRAREARRFDAKLLLTLTVPTLVLAGAEDKALEAILSTHRLIPGAQLVILPNTGHLSNLENPNAFNTAVLNFLRQLNLSVG